MKHKAGIIGYGNMGSWHAENINSRIDDLEVVAIYDINEDRQALAKENGLIVCETAEELLASDIDLVIIATPNRKFNIFY